MRLPEPLAALRDAANVNPRLRVGLWLMLGVFWLYALLVLRDETGTANKEYQTLAKRVTRVQADANQKDWLSRAESAGAAQLIAENRLWQAGTIGLAQATFQDWLTQLAQQSGLTRPVITVAAQDDNAAEKANSTKAEVGGNADIWRVSAKVGFEFTTKDLYTLMGRLESHDKQIIVESLVIRSMPTPRAEMVLVAPFQKPAAVGRTK